MGRIRPSTLCLAVALAALLAVLLLTRDALLVAHSDESIFYFSSDAATYFAAYEAFYQNIEIAERPELFLVGSPILFMKLADGNLFLIQLSQLALMAVSLWVGVRCFSSFNARLAFIVGALVFPYFLFGFMSLNKEVFAMCSAIFFTSYLVRGNKSHVLLALVLAICARYYMVIALLALLFLVPRDGPPRLKWTVALLVLISIAAPIAKSTVPAYSSEDLLEAPGVAGILFSKSIDSYAYFLVYPFKYLTLIPLRAYSFMIDSTRLGNAMEGFISLLTLALVLPSLWLLFTGKAMAPLVRRLIIAALVAPVPIMWSEIMHWRYYSFVYFFLLTALVLHYVDRPRSARPPLVGAVHA